MWVYIARRLLWLPVLLFAVSLFTFSLTRFAPGDPVAVMLGSRYDPVIAERLRHSLGLDRAFAPAYFDYMWGAVRGDLGESFRFRFRPVGSLLLPKMWVSFQVNLVALLFSVGLGLPLGFWIAHKQGTWRDPTTVFITVFLGSIPIMVTIPATLWLLCLKLDLVPCSGWGGLFDARMVVPAITMGIFGVAGFTRLMRASTLDILGQDFIRTARSKGLTELVVDSRHVLRNAIIPIITILSLSLDGMLVTSFVTERILGVPGVGDFAIQAVFNRDYPIIMATTLIGATAFVIANLIADIAYTVIDPRIRYG